MAGQLPGLPLGHRPYAGLNVIISFDSHVNVVPVAVITYPADLDRDDLKFQNSILSVQIVLIRFHVLLHSMGNLGFEIRSYLIPRATSVLLDILVPRPVLIIPYLLKSFIKPAKLLVSEDFATMGALLHGPDLGRLHSNVWSSVIPGRDRGRLARLWL